MDDDEDGTSSVDTNILAIQYDTVDFGGFMVNRKQSVFQGVKMAFQSTADEDTLSYQRFEEILIAYDIIILNV